MEKYIHSHFGMVESWPTCFYSDPNKASTSISPASEASASCLFYYFSKKRKNKVGSFVVECTIPYTHVLSKCSCLVNNNMQSYSKLTSHVSLSIKQPFSLRVTITNLMLGNLESMETKAIGNDEAPIQAYKFRLEGKYVAHET
jgi:hypothetical protein